MVKPLHILVIALILGPPLLYTGAFFHHPRVRVGIVRDELCEERHALLAKDAFKIYPDCFQAVILDHTFNVSKALGPGDSAYPQIVIDVGDPVELRRKYEVDVIIFVVNSTLIAGNADDRGIGGKADTLTGSAVVSVAHFTDGTDYSNHRIKHITMHETFHLLGYLHDRWDRRCVMNTAGNKEETRLNYFYEFQLPVRLYVFKLGLDKPFPQAAFITAFSNFLLWIPYIIGCELVLLKTYQKAMRGRGLPMKWLLLGLGLSAVVMGTSFDSILQIVVPICLMIFIHHYHYTLDKLAREPLIRLDAEEESAPSRPKRRRRRQILCIHM